MQKGHESYWYRTTVGMGDRGREGGRDGAAEGEAVGAAADEDDDDDDAYEGRDTPQAAAAVKEMAARGRARMLMAAREPARRIRAIAMVTRPRRWREGFDALPRVLQACAAIAVEMGAGGIISATRSE